MTKTSRRAFLGLSSSAVAASAAPNILCAAVPAQSPRLRVLVGSHTQSGILFYAWDPIAGNLTPTGKNSSVANVAWLAYSPGNQFVYTASELDRFQGKPTGEVASFRVADDGALQQLSARSSAGTGTCQVAVDQTGHMLVAVDYAGGSAASFHIQNGILSEAVWTEHYTEHGPNPDRQKTAHAHFASFSPDNRFVYINDLGGDSIHIYRPDPVTAAMTPAGIYRGAPGSGPRTLHFHPNGHTAYCINEMSSTVDVLEWHPHDGSLTLVDRIALLPADYKGPTRACDTVISRNGRFVYFANRDDNFLYSFRADFSTGKLTPIRRSNCGGKEPRNFVLDPTERWMLVANQSSSLISIFARDRETGELADEPKQVEAETPMRILFA